MKYRIAFSLFVAVFMISTVTMFLPPFKSAVSDYTPITPDQNEGLSRAKENASTSPAASDSKEPVKRKSGKANKNTRSPEAKPAPPTPTPIREEVAGLNYVNLTCTIISAIGAVFSAIFAWRQDRRYKP